MSLRHAVLGLLSVRPMSGYEVKKIIDGSVAHFWSADQSQIYRTLGALVSDGLATRQTVVQDERPNLHLHSITDAGTEALDAWLVSPLARPVTRDAFLARLFFADRLSVAQIRALLEERRRQTQESLEALEAIEVPEVRSTRAERLRFATLDNGLTHMRAELEWLDTLLHDLEEDGA